jgi:hypothetical protein
MPSHNIGRPGDHMACGQMSTNTAASCPRVMRALGIHAAAARTDRVAVQVELHDVVLGDQRRAC